MPEYLFVYGTLRKDYDLKLKDKVSHRLKYVGKGKVSAALYDLGRYPGAVPVRGAGKQEVIGDVFLIAEPAEVLRVLDKYEGVTGAGSQGEEFVRKKGRVRLRSGRQLTAWIYWYNPEARQRSLTPLRYKDYLNYLKNKRSH